MPALHPPPVSLLDKYRGAAFEPIYTTTVTASGGEARHARASGIVRSDDGKLDLALRLPTELGGDGGRTNPEQLFAAAYAACFHGALNLLATRNKVEVREASVRVTVGFGRDPVDGLFMLTAEVAIDLPGVPRPVAEELVRNTERFCPYAKMARNGIASVVALAPAADNKV
ncbi:Ohr family peroxiredoxin [Variovorax sp. DAIF25]|uniref:Ohr family peroxiredoxin n=1 Tax=Variovorax sp. DAIF25 TaxID=3080983 RepID=UPI003D6A4927